MGQFPQLNEEDAQLFNTALNDLLAKTEAGTALIVEKAGYLIQECGNPDKLDTTNLATLASNAFNATQFMASIIQENDFTGMYQQGQHFSTLILNLDENSLLVVIFPAALSVGMIKYYAAETIKLLANQLQVATARAPEKVFDLIDLNATDIGSLIRRKDTPG
jgi:predicted regulator of Ras-like GTPase activity (Roadblock/LC7/MglB family)